MSRSSRIVKSLLSLDMKNLAIELIIVVVGVLIAVGIDDYASNLKKRTTANTYLENLHADIVKDTAELVRSIDFAQTKVNNLKLVLDTLASGHIPEAPIEPFLNPHIQFIGLENHISFQTQTIEALRETGNFELIQNDSLVNLLFEYQKTCTTLLTSEAADNRFIRDVIEVYLYENIPLRRLNPFVNFYPKNNPLVSNEEWFDILTEKKFENLMLASMLRAMIIIDTYSDTLNMAKKIILEIEDMLAK